ELRPRKRSQLLSADWRRARDPRARVLPGVGWRRPDDDGAIARTGAGCTAARGVRRRRRAADDVHHRPPAARQRGGMPVLDPVRAGAWARAVAAHERVAGEERRTRRAIDNATCLAALDRD